MKLTWLFSARRRIVNWRLIGWGTALQLAFAQIVAIDEIHSFSVQRFVDQQGFGEVMEKTVVFFQKHFF